MNPKETNLKISITDSGVSLFAGCLSLPFENHVLKIVIRRSKKKVIQTNTLPIVALVEHKDIFRYVPKMKNPSPTMSIFGKKFTIPLYTECAIPPATT